jgi:DNA-binding HxlR family transcriptional regulator
MSDTEKNKPVSTAHDNAWQQVSAIVGPEYLSTMSADNRAGLQTLVDHASSFGRHPHGPVREIQTLVGDRWSALVLLLLHHGALRFSILQRITGVIDNIGISRRMLSFTLRTLERNGLVTRTVIATVPPNVEYALTPLGHKLGNRVLDFLDWLTSMAADIEAARAVFEQKHAASASPSSEAHTGHDE